MLRINVTRANINLELKEDVRCLRIYEKEEAEFGKVYKRNQEKGLKRFDKVLNAAQDHEFGELYSCHSNAKKNPNTLYLEHFNSELCDHHTHIQKKKERLKSEVAMQKEA